MNEDAYYQRLEINGNQLFTIVLLPHKGGKFPVVILRSPYVQNAATEPEEVLVQDAARRYESWLKRGYAIVFQHCRGQGKSTGAFVPYIFEREDGLALRQWIRQQPFYNGTLFLWGSSYTASLHYATAPFETDICGAVFEVQDSERYRLWYRNGQMRKGHANWHFELYKSDSGHKKDFTMQSFSRLPLKGLSKRALGETAEDFEQMLTAQMPTNPFWNTRFGGEDARNALIDADIPILLTTGYNDFYVGGVFKMWNDMDTQTRSKSAMLVSPYNHGDSYSSTRGCAFLSGKRSEQFGTTYQIDWLDHILKGTPLPYEKGVITYYRTFENRWESDFYKTKVQSLCIPLGTAKLSFAYDPYSPTAFSAEGTFSTETQGSFIRVFTKPLDRDVFVKGQMRAKLTVSSDCEDTSFYLRISLCRQGSSYVLRHDITSLGYQLGAYRANDVVSLDFCFDEYAFLLQKGDCLQIDIAATDDNTYVAHTNQKGDYYLQTDVKTAHNTVYLAQSELYLPIEQ